MQQFPANLKVPACLRSVCVVTEGHHCSLERRKVVQSIYRNEDRHFLKLANVFKDLAYYNRSQNIQNWQE